jgi:RND superfamily putative drug exporter
MEMNRWGTGMRRWRMDMHRWGATMARKRRAVIAGWLVLLVACGAAFPMLSGQLGSPDYGVDGSESTRVSTLLRRHFAGQGNEQDVIVLDAGRGGHIAAPANRSRVGRIVATARRQRGVVTVIGPFDPSAREQVSPDGSAALAVVGLAGGSRLLPARAKDLQSAITRAEGGQVRAYLTGYSPITNDQSVVEGRDSERAESVGMPVALAVMVVALGALVAALLPLLLAVAGLVLTFGVIYLLTFGFTFDTFLLTIVTMIGTGIGIDYALFVVSRFREELARRNIARGGEDHAAVADAVGVAVATSGRTILFSGVIVGISVCSLAVVNTPVFREISAGVLISVVCTLVAALTLLPAVLATLGPRVGAGALPERFRPADTKSEAAAEAGVWAKWARVVMNRPVTAGVLVTAVLVVCALPLTGLKYGIDLGTASLKGRPAAHAQAVLNRSFSPGAVSPIQVLVSGPGDGTLDPAGLRRAERLKSALSGDGRVAGVQTIPGDGRVLLDVEPRVAIDSGAATSLVRRIRRDLAPAVAPDQVLVGGATAQFYDLSQETTGKLPYVLALVLGLSLLFLLVAFRSLILPVKAVVMNLLVTGASIGLTVAVFQWGIGESLLGFTSAGFLQVYLPITVFVLLFGLSMDYEVFLIRRMKETWDSSGDNTRAVASGIEHTARPIAAAAAIMVAVFGSFLTAGILELKEFGLALAAAIALDATLVRLVLVPAFMRLLGAWNWWLPFTASVSGRRSEPCRSPNFRRTIPRWGGRRSGARR